MTMNGAGDMTLRLLIRSNPADMDKLSLLEIDVDRGARTPFVRFNFDGEIYYVPLAELGAAVDAARAFRRPPEPDVGTPHMPGIGLFGGIKIVSPEEGESK